MKVVEGFNVVKAVEACGAKSGATAFDVMIGDCGQLKPAQVCCLHSYDLIRGVPHDVLDKLSANFVYVYHQK